MNYYELTFSCSSPVETEVVMDILSSELGKIGFESFTQTPDGMIAFIAEKDYDKEALEKQLALFPLLHVRFTYTQKLVEGRDWNEEWEKNYFQPIRIDKECIIRASFHENEPGYNYTILIDPKMAFGTGNHETTRLMIQSMLEIDLTGKSLLDMGCGTGILAILAALKGADRVVAVDIDEWAYHNALENMQLNGTEEVKVVLGGAEKIAGEAPFDVIFANINRNILLRDIHVYRAVLQSGGTLFMSGFYQSDLAVIEEECRKNGLSIVSFKEQNNWVAARIEGLINQLL